MSSVGQISQTDLKWTQEYPVWDQHMDTHPQSIGMTSNVLKLYACGVCLHPMSTWTLLKRCYI